MYRKEDAEALKRQLRRRTLCWLLPEAALLFGVAWSFVRRIAWLTPLMTSLLGAVILFSLTVCLLPLRRYAAFVSGALAGRSRRSVVTFDSREEAAVLREGVRIYPVHAQGGGRAEYQERLFYWDANLPPPAWQAGERLALLTHERFIVGWSRAGEDEPLSE